MTSPLWSFDCEQVASDHVASACHFCNGPLRATQPADGLRKGLTVFRNIARFHGFELLQEVAEWMLRSGGGTLTA